jgi:hypothetical protein
VLIPRSRAHWLLSPTVGSRYFHHGRTTQQSFSFRTGNPNPVEMPSHKQGWHREGS